MNREAERKRLVELVHNFLEEELGASFVKVFLNKLADHLLDNGIVVPPVKVGQTVYSIQGFNGKPEQCEPYTVDDITIYENTLTIHIRDEWLFIRNMYPDDIGKTVFTSREDALKALEGSGEK